MLQVVPMVQKPIMQSFELHFDYTQMNDVMMLVKQLNCEIDAQEQSLFIPVSYTHLDVYKRQNYICTVAYSLPALAQVM